MLFIVGIGIVASALVAAIEHDKRRDARPWIAMCGLLWLVFCAAALTGCPPWDRPACGSPRAFVCVNDQPHVCSPSQRLTPIGDAPCAAVGGVCVVGDGGVAFCEVPDAQH